MREEDFEELRDWAKERCVKANIEATEKVNLGLDSLKDLDMGDDN